MAKGYLVRSDWEARIWIDGVGEAERRLEVTPAIAAWDYLSFRTYTFRAGQVIDGESAEDEMSMVLLSGAVTVEIDGPGGSQTWTCVGREHVFDGPPFALYLPPGHTYKTTVHRDADCAYGRAPAQGLKPPQLITPDQAAAGADSAGNRVNRILGPEITEHLLCQETIIEPGGWAFLPPHRHDDHDASVSPYLEEVSYYRTDPAHGWGLQRLTGTDRQGVVPLSIQHGDAVIIRSGEHPLVASPQTRLYVLTYLAGPLARWPQ